MIDIVCLILSEIGEQILLWFGVVGVVCILACTILVASFEPLLEALRRLVVWRLCWVQQLKNKYRFDL